MYKTAIALSWAFVICLIVSLGLVGASLKSDPDPTVEELVSSKLNVDKSELILVSEDDYVYKAITDKGEYYVELSNDNKKIVKMVNLSNK